MEWISLPLRHRIGAAVIYLLLGGLVFGLAGMMLKDGFSVGALAVAGFFGAVGLMFAAQVAAVLTWRVRLTPGRIETASLFGERSLARSDIKGCRWLDSGALQIVSDQKLMVLDREAVALPAVQEWLVGLTDLDIKDQVDQWEALEREESRGEAPAGRVATLERLARPIQIALLVVWFLSLGLVLLPDRLWPVLVGAEAAALAAAFAALLARDYASVMPPQGSPLINLAPVWAWIPLMIAFRLLGRAGWSPEHFIPLAPLALPAALGFWGVTLWSAPNARKPINAMGAGLVALAWGFGLIGLVRDAGLLGAFGG